MPPGSSVIVVQHQVTDSGNVLNSSIHYYMMLPVREDRTFSYDTDAYAFGTSSEDDHYQRHDTDAFRMRVFPNPDPTKFPIDEPERPWLDEYMAEEMWWPGIESPPELAAVDGEFVDNGTASNVKTPLDLSGTVQTIESGPERIDKRYVSIPPSGQETISF